MIRLSVKLFAGLTAGIIALYLIILIILWFTVSPNKQRNDLAATTYPGTSIPTGTVLFPPVIQGNISVSMLTQFRDTAGIDYAPELTNALVNTPVGASFNIFPADPYILDMNQATGKSVSSTWKNIKVNVGTAEVLTVRAENRPTATVYNFTRGVTGAEVTKVFVTISGLKYNTELDFVTIVNNDGAIYNLYIQDADGNYISVGAIAATSSILTFGIFDNQRLAISATPTVTEVKKFRLGDTIYDITGGAVSFT